jgi:hypothetical protein
VAHNRFLTGNRKATNYVKKILKGTFWVLNASLQHVIEIWTKVGHEKNIDFLIIQNERLLKFLKAENSDKLESNLLHLGSYRLGDNI